MALNIIIFILSLMMNIFVTANTLRKVTDRKFQFVEKHDNLLDKTAIICSVIALILGIFDSISKSFLGLHNYYITSAVYMAASLFLASAIESSTKYKKFLVFCTKTFTIVMLLELFVFNFGSYNMIMGNYPEMTFSVDEAEIQTEDNNTTDISYTFYDINIPVGSVSLDTEIIGTCKPFMFKLNIADETSQPLRDNAARIWAIPGYKDSYITPVLLSGNVSDLQVKVYLPDSQDVTIHSVTVNAPVPVHFSFARFLVLMGFPLFAYSVLNLRKFTQSVKDDHGFFRMCIKIAAICSMAALTLIMFTSQYTDAGFESLFSLTEGDQMTQDIVDAFESGHTYMTFEPSEDMLALENPYDTNQRLEEGLGMFSDYAWDHLLYNGKYYSYYGIAPVVLLFLPYHMITGFYFPAVIAVYIFSMIGIIFLSGIYTEFTERFFPKLPVGMAVTGGIVMLASCGIWISMGRPEFYEIAIASGFAFICSGAYFFLTSNIMNDGKISLKRLALSSVLLSLGVLSRPTTAVYCVCAVIFILMAYRKASVECGRKTPVKYLCCAFLPFVLIGSVQMIYNYVRFGSPLDFGIQYSLTINDFTKAQYHTKFVAVTIFNYIFNMPAFIPEFPFIKTTFYDFNIDGFYYKDFTYVNGVPLGLIFRATPVIAYLFAKKAYFASDNPLKRKNTAYIGIFSIAAPLAILCSIWESGYSARYTADFSWEILIGAYVILYTLILKCKSEDMRKIICKTFVAGAMISFVVDFAQAYSFFMAKGVSENYEASYYVFARMFDFWK